MTYLFTASTSHAQLDNAEVFFNEDKYHFLNGSQKLLVLQRTHDTWLVTEGKIELIEPAADLLDRYLMSQH